MTTANRAFALLGASGLVGGHLLRILAADPSYAQGILLTRRGLGLEGGRIREATVDFDRPESFRSLLAVDDVFCCLGTTIKKAGSEAAFHKVDCDIPVAVGREARTSGVGQFLIVTAVGADPKSRVFYSRVKGEVEATLRALDFHRGLKIFHPSLIVGEREESRPADRFAKVLLQAARPLLAGSLARYRAIEAGQVARAMHRVALEEPAKSGVEIYEGHRLFAMAG
jgi:uncharacterized protein YbjT (DUF2867 family)